MFHQFGMPFSQGACFWKKRKWLVSEAPGLCIPVFFCQTGILGGAFKYGLPDGRPDMAFQTGPSRHGLPKWLTGWHLDLPKTWFCD